MQPTRIISEGECGRTSRTHDVRLVFADVLLKRRTKSIIERRIWAWFIAAHSKKMSIVLLKKNNKIYINAQTDFMEMHGIKMKMLQEFRGEISGGII